MRLAEVLAPAIEMAEGYPVEESMARSIHNDREWLLQWPQSRKVFFPNEGEGPEGEKPKEEAGKDAKAEEKKPKEKDKKK